MEKLSEIFWGNDYSIKMEKFKQAIKQINEDYKDVEKEFNHIDYTIIPNENGEIKLIIDENKNIPNELIKKVKDTFEDIWK